MTKLLSQQKTRPRIFFRLHSLTSILNMGQYKIGFLIINNEFNLHKTKKPYYVYHKTEKKNIKRGTRIESPKRSKLRLKKVRQFRRCRGHQLNRILGSLPLSFPIPIHIPRPFNAIVTWCNKLKLTKSVRQCAVCNVQLATRNVQRATRILLQLRCKCRSFRFDSFSSFYLFFFFCFAAGNLVSVSNSRSLSLPFFGAWLDNKCQHLVAANLFARPMRSPHEVAVSQEEVGHRLHRSIESLDLEWHWW